MFICTVKMIRSMQYEYTPRIAVFKHIGVVAYFDVNS